MSPAMSTHNSRYREWKEAWRSHPSSVKVFKEAYRKATKVQRNQMRAWMREIFAERNKEGLEV